MKRTSWKVNRISWFPFIAWEEHRLGGAKNKIVWVDTPSKVQRTNVSRGRVGSLKSFTKGTAIPQHLRPKGTKILWVLLDKQLVRKVFVNNAVASEARYDKDRLPMHPFIVAHEIPNSGKQNRKVTFFHPLRTVTIIVNQRGAQKITVDWKNKEDSYSLPSKSSQAFTLVTSNNQHIPEKPRQTKTSSTVRAIQPKLTKPRKTIGKPLPDTSKAIKTTSRASKKIVVPSGKASKPSVKTAKWKPDNKHVLKTYSNTISSPAWNVKSIAGKTVVSLLQQGRYRNALDLAIRKRKSNPKNYELLFLEGVSTAWCGNLKRALILLEKAERMNKSYKAPTIEIALIRTINGKAHQALGILSKFRAEDKTNRYYFVLGTTLYIMRNIQEAYEASIKGSREPNAFESFFLAGKCASLLGKKSIARDYFRQLMTDCPVNYHTLLPSAVLQPPTKSNDLKYSSIVKKQPVSLLLHTSIIYGDLEFTEENYRRATEGFAKACLLKPDSFESIFNCAISLEKSSKRKEAISMYQRLSTSFKYKEAAKKKITELTIFDKPEASFVEKYAHSSRKNVSSHKNTERSKALDNLFNSVKINIAKAERGETDEEKTGTTSGVSTTSKRPANRLSQRLKNITTITSTTLEEKSPKVIENVVSGHRKTGAEVRYGGKGEKKGLKNAIIRLTPHYDFPMTLNKYSENQSFSYSIGGQVATGNWDSIKVELTAESVVNKSLKLQTSRVVTSAEAQKEWKTVNLSLTTPLLDNKAPLFSVIISATKNGNETKTVISKCKTKISYGTKP